MSLAAAHLGLVALAGCAGDGAEATPEGPRIVLEDFEVKTPSEPVRAGTVDLVLDNQGPTVHELVVARTELAADALPIGPDGLSVTEDDPQVEIIDEIEEVELGEIATLRVTLEPGHYVLFCNLEGHYLGGMYADLEVVA